MTWFADLITSSSITGSDPALAVRLAGVTASEAYVPVRISTEGGFTDQFGGNARVQSRIDDATTGPGTGFMYIGFASLGIASSASEWSIKRIEFVTGDPVHTTWSSLSASWDNRVSEGYT